MSIQSSIDSYLRADSTFMNYIGGVGAPTLSVGRLYYMMAPEGATLPYCVYTMVSNTDSQTFFSSNDGQGRLQFDIVAETRAAYAIDERLRTLLRYRSGPIGYLVYPSTSLYPSTTLFPNGGLLCWMIEPANRRERFNPDTLRYVFSSDYIVNCTY